MTNAPMQSWSTLTAPQALVRYAPSAAVALDDLIAATGIIDKYPRLGEYIRAVCARTLMLPSLAQDFQNNKENSSHPLPDAMRHVVHAFVEQFSLDVSALDDTLRAPFMQLFDDDAQIIAHAVYVADMVPRLRRVLEQLFDSPNAVWPHAQMANDIPSAFFEFVRVVYNLRELDPVTTELVRLRGARQHNCRLCKSLRAHSALAAGGTEQHYAAVDHYRESDDLTAAQKAALALVDAMIWQPAHIDGGVIAEIRHHFTPVQAVELALDVTRNAANKSIVSLGADAAPFDDVQIYDIDCAGNMQVGLQAPQ